MAGILCIALVLKKKME
ncbi:MAG: hypothetical protein ACXV5H_05350 [Halobacteriota archaeon]